MLDANGLTMAQILDAVGQIKSVKGAIIDRRFELPQADGSFRSVIVVDAPEDGTADIRALAYLEKLYGKWASGGH
ncbi:hypothetical protein [Tardiphaga sp. 11_C7_N12_6]|uniref:hypothetical protein n=1 Tax=Tardiphaga sp. 11_C7_N12_6 TaxID=3240789 RepID=UPI003F25FCB1